LRIAKLSQNLLESEKLLRPGRKPRWVWSSFGQIIWQHFFSKHLAT